MLKGRRGQSTALLASVFLLPLLSVAADQVAVGRYVRITTAPTASQWNPLETVVTIAFPKGQVDTVGAAARYLLSRSGYRLADPKAGSNPPHAKLLRFPLPDVQRAFELVTVMGALEALGGPSYAPRVDHVERTVTYQLRDVADDVHATSAPAKATPLGYAAEPRAGRETPPAHEGQRWTRAQKP